MFKIPLLSDYVLIFLFSIDETTKQYYLIYQQIFINGDNIILESWICLSNVCLVEISWFMLLSSESLQMCYLSCVNLEGGIIY